MHDIPVDFSALSIAYCARRYQFSCVRGVDSSSPDTDFGNAAHALFEARNRGDTRPITDIGIPLSEKWQLSQADTTKLMLCGIGFDQQKNPLPIIDTANTPLVEYKFSIPYATVGNYRIVLCGTMDLVYCQDNKFLVIRDYKTCAALGPAADKIVASYTSSLQLQFYAYAIYKYLHAFLPTEYADMALRLAITGEFMMVYKSAPIPKFDRTPFMQVTPYTIQSTEAVINMLIPKLIAIHELDTIAPPEGSVYKLCNKCPYYNLCLCKDEHALLNSLAKIPVKQYDPTNFR
jgi:hypothetical protein